jgi:FkbM family methyltransferase
MSRVRELIKRALLRRDIILSRPPGQFNITMLKLAQARDRGLRVNLAIDGGAAEGEWADELRQIYPSASVLCVEPRAESQPELKRRAAATPGLVHVAQTLLGAREGTIEFYESEHNSSMLKDAAGREWGKKVIAPVTTLDALITKLGLPEPELIKLDLQGAELEALRGATRCLAHAEAVMLEVSFIEFQKGMPLIGEVIPFMAGHGFRLYDVTALWHRPLDGALAQGDFMFVSDRSRLVSDTRWSAD